MSWISQARSENASCSHREVAKNAAGPVPRVSGGSWSDSRLTASEVKIASNSSRLLFAITCRPATAGCRDRVRRLGCLGGGRHDRVLSYCRGGEPRSGGFWWVWWV